MLTPLGAFGRISGALWGLEYLFPFPVAELPLSCLPQAALASGGAKSSASLTRRAAQEAPG